MDYEQALQEALDAVNAQQAQQQMAANIEAGNAAYGQLKDQAAVSRGLERQRLAKRMADMGISAPQPLTVQNNSMMAGNRDIGDISAQNRSYAGMQNAMINQANANAQAQGLGITAAMNAAENASMLDEKMNEFDRLYRLYMAKKITKNQFKLKTGMDVRGWAVRKKPPTIDLDKFFGDSTGNPAVDAIRKQAEIGINMLNKYVDEKKITEEQAYDYFINALPPMLRP